MAHLTLRLEFDPTTRKKNVIVSYSSDADALPQEHEEMHRALVDRLLQGGLLQGSELGRIVVEREGEAAAAKEADVAQPQSEAEGLKQGR